LNTVEEIQKKLSLSQQQALAYSRDFAKIYRLEREKRQRILEMNQKLRAILNSMSDLMVATDTNFTIQETNPAFLRIFASGNRRVTGKSLWEVLGSTHLKAVAHDIQPGSAHKEAVSCQFPAAPDRFFDVSIARISGKSGGFVFVFRDVTERVRFERMRKRFITFASHEINTPLHGLLGFVHLLYENLKDRLSSEERSHFKFLLDSGENLRLLVQDLAHFSPGHREYSPENENVAVREALEQAIQRVRLDVESIGIHILIDGEEQGTVRGEKDLLVKAFESVLKTYVIYSGLDATIRIRIDYDGDRIAISFCSSEKIEELEELQRHLTENTGLQGRPHNIGLGLALAKDIVEWLGGKMRFEQGNGAKLIILLPRTIESSQS